LAKCLKGDNPGLIRIGGAYPIEVNDPTDGCMRETDMVLKRRERARRQAGNAMDAGVMTPTTGAKWWRTG
jgi:hypothetical protein